MRRSRLVVGLATAAMLATTMVPVPPPPTAAFDCSTAPNGCYEPDYFQATMERVSVTSSGAEGGGADAVAITADGRDAFFESSGSSYDGSTVSGQALWVRDRQTGTTTRLDLSATGHPDAVTSFLVSGVSSDGRFIAFTTPQSLDPHDTDTASDVYLLDRTADTVELISVSADGTGSADDSVSIASVSDDGRHVAYVSAADNLVPNDTNGVPDVFVRDREARTTTRVSVASDGSQAEGRSYQAVISGDGSTVAFTTGASLVPSDTGYADVYVHDLASGTTMLLSLFADGSHTLDPGVEYDRNLAISDDGQQVAFVAIGRLVLPDDNFAPDAFVRDRTTGTTVKVSVASDGSQSYPYHTGSLGGPRHIGISGDGRYVVFDSDDDGDLVPYDDDYDSPDVFIHDRVSGTTDLVSRSNYDRDYYGYVHDGACLLPTTAPADSVSQHGRFITWTSPATNIVEGDTNGSYDAFVTEISWDAAPPSWPSATLRATDVGSTYAALSWTPADDDVGVTSYHIYQDGAEVGQVDGGATSATVTGLSPDTSYTFSVQAEDAVGNLTTDGPSATITTAATATPGTAALQATASEGGVVDLLWDPSDLSGLSGYRVYRADDGGTASDVATVGAGTTTYEDTGLAADTSFTYHVVALDASGTEHNHTVDTTVSTPPLRLDGASWMGARATDGSLLPASAVLLRADGEPNRQATATVTYQDWYEGSTLLSSPQTVTTEVRLSEDPTRPGSYTAAWTLPEGVAEVTSVTGILDDGAGHAVWASAPGLPLGLTGWLDVTVDAPAAGLAGSQLVASSDGRVRGRTQLDGTTTAARVVGIPATPNATLDLRSSDWGVLGTTTAAVQAGLGTSVTIRPVLPATLEVDVSGPDGPLADVTVLASAPDGTPIGMRTTGTSGTVSFGGLHDGEVVHLVATVSDDRLLDAETTTDATLTYGSNTAAVHVAALPIGTVQGEVLDASGQPVSGDGTVHLSQTLPGGRQHTVETLIDGSGHYSFSAAAGAATLTAGTGEGTTTPARVDIPDGGTVTQDLAVPSPVSASIDVRLEIRYPGGDWQEIPVDKRTAYHFHLAVTDDLGDWPAWQGSPITGLIHPAETTATVCVDGYEAGLGSDCELVTLGADHHGSVDFRLEAASGFHAALVAPDGTPATEAWTAYVRRLTARADAQETVAEIPGSGGDLDATVAESGTYAVDIVTASGKWASFTVSAPDNDTVDVGAITLRDPGSFSSTGSSSLILAGGDPVAGESVELRADVHNDGDPVNGASLEFVVPAGSSVPDGGVTVDGSPAPVSVIGDGVDAVDLGDLPAGSDHVVRVRLDVADVPATGLFGSAAWLVAGTERDLVDVIVDEVGTQPSGGLTITAPAFSRALDVPVAGTAPPGVIVDVSGDGSVLATTVAGPDGRWQATVPLPDLGPWHHHQLHASTPGGATSHTVTVQHDPTYPIVTRLAMEQEDGPRVEYDPSGGPVTFPYVVIPGRPIQVDFDVVNPELVVSAVVEIGDLTAPATRGDDGVWRASIPGTTADLGPVWVALETRYGADFTSRAEPTIDDMKEFVYPPAADALDPVPTDASATTTSSPTSLEQMLNTVATSDQTQSATFSRSGVDIGAASPASFTVSVTATPVSYIPTAADEALSQRLGLNLYDYQFTYSVSASQVTTHLAVTLPADEYQQAATATASTTSLVTAINRLASFKGQPTARGSLLPLAGPEEAVEAISLAFDMSMSADGIQGAYYSSTADQINALAASAAACDGPAGPGLRNAAADLQRQYVANETIKLGVGVVTTLTIEAPPLAVAAGLAAWGLGAGLDQDLDDDLAALDQEIAQAYTDGRCDKPEPPPTPPFVPGTSSSDAFSRWLDCVTAPNKTPYEKKQCGPDPLLKQGDPQYIYDPSGYVYDGVTANRVEGATTTILAAPSPTGPWSVWDAADYGQVNPQTTDPQGRYGWDVPEGYFKVLVEADGYLPAASRMVQVLPAHFDINIGLTPADPPSVDGVTLAGDLSGVDIAFTQWMRADSLDQFTLRLTGNDGSPVAASVVPLDARTAPDGTSLVRHVRLAPDGGLAEGSSYGLTVDALVENHAGRTMAGDVTRTLAAAANHAPVAADDSFASYEDAALLAPTSVLANDTDADGQQLTAAIDEDPAHGSVRLQADGHFVYTPDPDFAGSDVFTYVASDGWADSAPARVTIDIRGTNDPPIASDDTYDTKAGTPLAVSGPGVLANDSDPDGDALAGIVVTSPAHGTLRFAGDGSFTYTADPAYAGADSFTYEAWDGAAVSSVARVTFDVAPANQPPTVSLGSTSQSVQYSDEIIPVQVTVHDPDSPPAALSLSQSGAPDDLALGGKTCTADASGTTCTWALAGQVLGAPSASARTITLTASDGAADSAPATLALSVEPEQATVTFGTDDPAGVQVADPGGTSGEFTRTLFVSEAVPDVADGAADPGDIRQASVNLTLAPVGPGDAVTGSCRPTDVTGAGYDQVLEVTCTFGEVPVNTYAVDAEIRGSYRGSSEDVLTVYDPSLGFATGGGTFYWPGTADASVGYAGDRTNFGFTMKYNKKGTNVKGQLLVIRHMPNGSIYRLKSNQLDGLALGGHTGTDPYAWASFAGKATYQEPGWSDPIGNHQFLTYVEDHSVGTDRIWLEVQDKDGDIVPALSLGWPATDNAQRLAGGNVVVPHWTR